VASATSTCTNAFGADEADSSGASKPDMGFASTAKATTTLWQCRHMEDYACGEYRK